jgi:hypothetical protein
MRFWRETPCELAILFCALLLTTTSHAARCGGDFNAFVAAMSQEAAAAGISREVIRRRCRR